MLLEELGDNKYRVAGGNAKSAKIGQILEFSKIELQYAYHIDEECFLQEDGTMSTRVIGAIEEFRI